MSENCFAPDVKFLSILEEAKALFTSKSKECQELLSKNAKLQNEVGLLRKERQELISKEERTTTQLTQLKMFMKNFFTTLRIRISEVNDKGVYNADTFSYAIGDVGRSLCEASFSVSMTKPPSKKHAATSKLSTNKEKTRTRYKTITPLDLSNITKPSKNMEQYLLTSGLKKTVHKSEKPSKDMMNVDNYNFLDEDGTLHSPIGPPSRTSTPQGPCPDIDALGADYEPTSPSLLHGIQVQDMDNMDDPLLSQLHRLEHEIPESSQPQSPTIPSRSHKSPTSLNDPSSAQERRAKRDWNDGVSFGSLLAEPKRMKSECSFGGTRASFVDKGQKVVSKRSPAEEETVDNLLCSPDLIMVDDGGFLRPDAITPKTTPGVHKEHETQVHSGSLSLFSFQHSKSAAKTSGNDQELSKDENRDPRNESVEREKSKLVFNLDLEASGNEESAPEGIDEEAKQYKYIEVVRGKDKRAKLNGYFCADCEKYYGSLKLTEQEIQERLKACSRHRARFSPAPSTPEHFWDPGFMNTNDYIEKGFMRTESDLPPDKRRLKSRKTKGKLLKYNN